MSKRKRFRHKRLLKEGTTDKYGINEYLSCNENLQRILTPQYKLNICRQNYRESGASSAMELRQ
jgi:hypothetical protein